MGIIGDLIRAFRRGYVEERKTVHSEIREESNRMLDAEAHRFPYRLVTSLDTPKPQDIDRRLGITEFQRVPFPPDGAIWAFKSREDRKTFRARYREHVK